MRRSKRDWNRWSSGLDPIRSQLLAELAELDSAAPLASRMGLPRQKVNYPLRALELFIDLHLAAAAHRSFDGHGSAHWTDPMACNSGARDRADDQPVEQHADRAYCAALSGLSRTTYSGNSATLPYKRNFRA